jgi:hypothetical protein
MANGSWTLLGDARDDSWPRDNPATSANTTNNNQHTPFSAPTTVGEPGASVGAYFRVHAAFNANTSKYVLWVNVDYAPQCPAWPAKEPCHLVGTSDTPEGPFTFVGASNARFPGPGDFDLFVDDDGESATTVRRRVRRYERCASRHSRTRPAKVCSM